MASRTKTAAPSVRGSKLTIGLAGNPMVAVGVRMTPLVKSTSGRISGHHYCPTHLARVKTAYVCSEHGERLDETISGFEWDGKVVQIDKDGLGLESDKRIELKALVDAGDVDPIYFEKPYALSADPGQEAAFDLLTAALRESGKYAVGTAVLSKATKAIVVRWSEPAGCLIAHACTYDARIAWSDVQTIAAAGSARPQLEGKQAKEAAQLIAASLDDGFDFGDVVDEYGAELEAAVAAAAEGAPMPAKKQAPAPEPVADLMAALRASVGEAKAAKPKAKAKTNGGRKKVAA